MPGVIAHGMLTMGTALRVVTDWVRDPAKVTSYFVRFSNPVVVPDDEDGVEVSFTARVAAVESNRVSIAIEATSGEAESAGSGACRSRSWILSCGCPTCDWTSHWPISPPCV